VNAPPRDVRRRELGGPDPIDRRLGSPPPSPLIWLLSLLRTRSALGLAPSLTYEYGRLFSLRVRNQNTVLVNLPYTLLRDAELTLTVAYAGRLAPQPPERETVDRNSTTSANRRRTDSMAAG